MKKPFALFAAFLLVAFLALPAAAEGTTTLTVVLPDSYSLALTIQGKGTVKVGDVSCSKSAQLALARLEPVTIQVTPKEGWFLHSVKLNGKAQTVQKAGWTLTLDGVTEDMALEVTFRSTSGSPATGDRLWLSATGLLLSAAGLALCLKRRT